MITVRLPDDKGRSGDGRPRVHRFRSHWLELGRRLRDFRARYSVTQTEIARAIGPRDASTVAQWESGVSVPEGIRREHLIEILEGRRWRDLREGALVGNGLPESWDRGARWYRRASRERAPREGVGAVVAALLGDLRVVVSSDALRRSYAERDGEWAHGIADQRGFGEQHRADIRRIEDAAYGLRWLELAQRLCFDLSRSLVSQLALALLENERDGRPAKG